MLPRSKNKVVLCVAVALGMVAIKLLLLMQDLHGDEVLHIHQFESVKKKTVHPLSRLLPPLNESAAESSKMCLNPHLDLQHDSLAYAFHSMPRLNCSGRENSLFSLSNGKLIPNSALLARKRTKSCLISSIGRYSDAISLVSQAFELAGNTTVHSAINFDFVYVRCIFNSSEEGDLPGSNNVQMENVLGPQELKEEEHQVNNQSKPLNNVKSMHVELLPQDVVISNGSQSQVFAPGVNAREVNNKTVTGNKESGSYNAKSPSRQSQNKNRFESQAQVKHSGFDIGSEKLRKVRSFSDSQLKSFNSINETERNYAEQEKSGISTHLSRMLLSDYDSLENPDMLLEEFDQQLYSFNELLEDGDLDGDSFSEIDCDEEQFLVQVSPKHSVFERARKAERSKHSSGLNVLMFGLDSMSSASFRRKLPATLNYLTQDLDAVVLDWYNIVGDATTQAFLPMFLGKLEQEIQNVTKEFLDPLNFLWKHFRHDGYATIIAEDEPEISVFTLRLGGFIHPPTDHFMRHFWQVLGESNLRRACSDKFCTGSMPNHRYLLNYLADFYDKYSNISRFALGFSGELSHSDNNPSEYIDLDLKNFLAGLESKGYLKNTVLVVFSDHGARYSKVRQTVQGKLEERLPFFSLVFPRSFRKQHAVLYKALQKNARRITSPFDVHETLLDLLDLSKAYAAHQSPLMRPVPRGISLFRPVPPDRKCKDAGIETHWCACVQQTPVPLSDPLVKGAFHAVVNHLNTLTRQHSHVCRPLSIHHVHTASLVLPDPKVLNFRRTEEKGNFTVWYHNQTTVDRAELQVVLQTSPCGGVFESTVQVLFPNPAADFTSGGGGSEVRFEVEERDISRINEYKSQSACIVDRAAHLMKFCCCKGHEEKTQEK